MQTNQITYEQKGNLVYCFVQLTGERKKLIGTINQEDRTLYKKISPTKHTFNKSNSIAIAYELLKLDYDFIVIECGYNTHKTTRQFFLENSDFKRFGDYELQKFLPISEFGLERVEVWEKEQAEILREKLSSILDTSNKNKVIQESLFA
ncbi:MAG: hypothetical protein M3R36_05970 [Bacteroidota bacterium]|nr:hypothetical protein [Bacteroidota bacterium]